MGEFDYNDYGSDWGGSIYDIPSYDFDFSNLDLSSLSDPFWSQLPTDNYYQPDYNYGTDDPFSPFYTGDTTPTTNPDAQGDFIGEPGSENPTGVFSTGGAAGDQGTPGSTSNNPSKLGQLAQSILAAAAAAGAKTIGGGAASKATGKSTQTQTNTPQKMAAFQNTMKNLAANRAALTSNWPNPVDPELAEWYNQQMADLRGTPWRSPNEETNRAILQSLIEKGGNTFDPYEYEQARQQLEKSFGGVKLEDTRPGGMTRNTGGPTGILQTIGQGTEQEQALRKYIDTSAAINRDIAGAWTDQARARMAYENMQNQQVPQMIKQYEDQYGKLNTAEDIAKFFVTNNLIPTYMYENALKKIQAIMENLKIEAGLSNIEPNRLGTTSGGETPGFGANLLSGILGGVAKGVGTDVNAQASQGDATGGTNVLTDFLFGNKGLTSGFGLW